jgi:hypothetical protein
MRKNKLTLLFLLCALAAACSDSYAPVTIPFRPRSVVDFAAFQDLYFIDFVLDAPEQGFDAGAEVRRVFVEEIPFAAGRPVQRLEPEHWADILAALRRYRLAVDIQYADSLFFQRVFRAHPRGLFFTGRLKLNVKKMGVIREGRDEAGKSRNVYDTVEMWEMEVQVALIDGDAQRVLWRETYAEKGEPVAGATARFTFSSMFAKLAAKLTAALQPRKTEQERHILSR